MPYVDTGAKITYIGHCRKCKFQWVIPANMKGKIATEANPHTGRVCPFCKCKSVYYSTEDNR